MQKLIAPLVLCALMTACIETNLPSPMPVPPPDDSPGARAADPDGGVGDPVPQPTPPDEVDEHRSSSLSYGAAYATQGIDATTWLGSTVCNVWGQNIPFDIYGKFSLDLDPSRPPGTVQMFLATFHGVTFADAYGRVALTLDGRVPVSETGYQTVAGSDITGPYIYEGNNAFPDALPKGNAGYINVAVTPISSDAPRGYVSATFYPNGYGYSRFCGKTTILWRRSDAITGGGSGGGSCPLGPC